MLCLVSFPNSNLVIRAQYFNIFPDTSFSIATLIYSVNNISITEDYTQKLYVISGSKRWCSIFITEDYTRKLYDSRKKEVVQVLAKNFNHKAPYKF
jgi:hypothetical protein